MPSSRRLQTTTPCAYPKTEPMKRLLILVPLSVFVLVPALVVAAIAFAANIGGHANRTN